MEDAEAGAEEGRRPKPAPRGRAKPVKNGCKLGGGIARLGGSDASLKEEAAILPRAGGIAAGRMRDRARGIRLWTSEKA